MQIYILPFSAIVRTQNSLPTAVVRGQLVMLGLWVRTQGDTKMYKKTFVTALVIGLLGTAGANAKDNVFADRGIVINQSNIVGNPLTINVADDNSFQVFTNLAPGAGQIYPSGASQADMGWFVRVGSALTAPAFTDHSDGTATGSIGPSTAFGARAVSGITGAGTAASPFSVTVTGTAAGMNATQVVTYVNGENFFRKSFTLTNPAATPVAARVFLGSDIYLANSDAGTPYREPSSGSPGGQTCAGIVPVFTILHISTGVASSGFSADGYNSVWTQIGAGALNNTVNPGACLDNGAALQWDLTVPAGGSSTVQAVTSFGEIPTGIIEPNGEAIALPTTSFYGALALAFSLMMLALAGVVRNRRA